MKVIYKFPLNRNGMNTYVPYYIYNFLKIDLSDGFPVMWAIVDDKDVDNIDVIKCYGTGWPIFGEMYYLDTITDGQGYVWHYFCNRDLKDDGFVKGDITED